MTAPQTALTGAPSLGRGLRTAARSCLGNRWTLLAFAAFALGMGLYFGGWGWLVAVGAAPVILSTLPCLIMCGFGVCMMCRGQKQSTASRETADTAATSVELTADVAAGRSAVSSSYCQEPTDEAPSPQITQLQSIKEAGVLDAQSVGSDEGNR